MNRGLLLGVDGGGTKTEFVLIDLAGRVRARRTAGSAYYLQIGLGGLLHLLRDGVHAVLSDAKADRDDILHAFFGLPSHGEDSAVEPLLDDLPAAFLGHTRYRCGNDMLCGWAGSLAGEDGINIVAGTGSIAYGERRGRAARAGGWGEVFSDEGSAYWIAIQGLNAFTRMSDGRLPRTALYDMVRRRFELTHDLDLCSRLMGEAAPARDELASLAGLVGEAAGAGDAAAIEILDRAAGELAAIIDAVRAQLDFQPGEPVTLSYSGGVFRNGEGILAPLRTHLAKGPAKYDLIAPKLSPTLGAALYAARLAGVHVTAELVSGLQAAG